MDIYKILYPVTGDHTFFPSTHGPKNWPHIEQKSKPK